MADKQPSLHVQVSEKIMGWQDIYWDSPTSHLMWWVSPGRAGICLGNPYAQIKRPSHNWNPTRNVNHAVEVVQRMRDLGFEYSARYCRDRLWEVSFHTASTDDVFTTTGPNIAAATCQAAIVAIDHRKPT